MIDVPLSMVAWVTVVLVQALVHYVVLGARRQRQQDDKLEETLSLVSNEGSLDDDFSAFPDISIVSDNSLPEDDLTPDSELSGVIIKNGLGGDEAVNFLQLLTQTGSEIMKVSLYD
jgi:hypothetical protein